MERWRKGEKNGAETAERARIVGDCSGLLTMLLTSDRSLPSWVLEPWGFNRLYCLIYESDSSELRAEAEDAEDAEAEEDATEEDAADEDATDEAEAEPASMSDSTLRGAAAPTAVCCSSSSDLFLRRTKKATARTATPARHAMIT